MPGELHSDALRALAERLRDTADRVEAGDYPAIEHPAYLAGKMRLSAKKQDRRAAEIGDYDGSDAELEEYIESEMLSLDHMQAQLEKSAEAHNEYLKLTASGRRHNRVITVLLYIAGALIAFSTVSLLWRLLS